MELAQHQCRVSDKAAGVLMALGCRPAAQQALSGTQLIPNLLPLQVALSICALLCLWFYFSFPLPENQTSGTRSARIQAAVTRACGVC